MISEQAQVEFTLETFASVLSATGYPDP